MPAPSIHETIERRARRAILERAFFRLENAIILAGAILLAFFLPHPLPTLLPWWGGWTWLLLGGLAVAALVASTLTDRQEVARAVEDLFRQEYNITSLRDRRLQEKLRRAQEYHEQIKEAVAAQADGALKDRLQRTADGIYDWIGYMVRLARRLDAYRNDPIIEADREDLKQSIPRLESRLRTEQDPRVRQQLEVTLADKRRLAESIAELDSRMQRAELRLDSSLAALGTVYSQLLLVGSKEIDSDRAERLRADISDEVAGLQDLVDSINEIYDYRTLGPGK
ncbi:MAG: hypothetical protein NZ528_10395 [Caldilineales bacterium]|nr:hypothetical protein [Caldilineales bacterium]MDW8317515.1 hypothetical protein [Anaerolineae bacterium]